MTSFDQATALTAVGDGVFTAELTADWAQGRASFGGAVSALALRAMAHLVPVDRPLRSLGMDFAAAVAPGPVQVRAEIIRTGKTLTHASVRVEQAGGICAVAHGAYGSPRKTALSLPAPKAPALAPPHEIEPFPYVEGVTPVFTRHFDYRWSSNRYPFTGATVASLGGWVRHAQPTMLDASGVLALIDAWPAPVLPLLHSPAPASTVTWMVNLATLGAPESYPADGWWLFDADAVTAADGYADILGKLWDPAGRLVATSRQLVAEFS